MKAAQERVHIMNVLYFLHRLLPKLPNNSTLILSKSGVDETFMKEYYSIPSKTAMPIESGVAHGLGQRYLRKLS